MNYVKVMRCFVVLCKEIFPLENATRWKINLYWFDWTSGHLAERQTTEVVLRAIVAATNGGPGYNQNFVCSHTAYLHPIGKVRY